MVHILLVEDDYVLNKTVAGRLRREGFETTGVTSAEDALSKLSEDFDLCLVDIDLPDFDGITLLDTIRSSHPRTPVIMISATIDMITIARAYEHGCDDYLKKPFDIHELVLKIRAFLRNTLQHVPLPNGYAFDRAVRKLYFENDEIDLTHKERELIALLVANRGRIVSHNIIASTVWPDEPQNAHVRQLLARVRQKLPAPLVETKISQGYTIP